MASVCENNNWETTKCINSSGPAKNSQVAAAPLRVPFNEMRHNQQDKVRNRYKGDKACVFQRIETVKERDRYDDKPSTGEYLYSINVPLSIHENCHPKLPLY